MVTTLVWFTREQKSELWECWRNGETIPAIARALGRGEQPDALVVELEEFENFEDRFDLEEFHGAGGIWS